MLNIGIAPPNAVKLSCMALTAPHEASVGDGGEQRRGGDAEAHLLALHVARKPVKAEAAHQRRRSGLRPIGERGAGEEQQGHRREDRPALPRIADRLTEGPCQPAADGEDRQHLDKVRKRRGVFERVRRIGVEEAAAVGAEHLDRFLAGDRPERQRLPGPFEGRRHHRAGKGLRYTERDIDQRQHDRRRQQDIERDARQIGPEIADACRLAPGEAADDGEGDGDAGRSRQEIPGRSAPPSG